MKTDLEYIQEALDHAIERRDDYFNSYEYHKEQARFADELCEQWGRTVQILQEQVNEAKTA